MELVYPNEVFSEKYNVVLLTIVEGVKLLPTRQKSSTQCLQRFNKIYLSSTSFTTVSVETVVTRLSSQELPGLDLQQFLV